MSNYDKCRLEQPFGALLNIRRQQKKEEEEKEEEEEAKTATAQRARGRRLSSMHQSINQSSIINRQKSFVFLELSMID
jgi:hypothetical protein